MPVVLFFSTASVTFVAEVGAVVVAPLSESGSWVFAVSTLTSEEFSWGGVHPARASAARAAMPATALREVVEITGKILRCKKRLCGYFERGVEALSESYGSAETTVT